MERVDVQLNHPRCPFCREQVRPAQSEQMRGCETCLTWHHAACWDERGGCSVCPAPGQVVAAQEKAAVPHEVAEAREHLAKFHRTLLGFGGIYAATATFVALVPHPRHGPPERIAGIVVIGLFFAVFATAVYRRLKLLAAGSVSERKTTERSPLATRWAAVASAVLATTVLGWQVAVPFLLIGAVFTWWLHSQS